MIDRPESSLSVAADPADLPSADAGEGLLVGRPAEAAPILGRHPRSLVTGWPIAVTLAVITVLLYEIRYALLPFVFAVAIAFVVEPLVVRLQGWTGGKRWVAATLVYLAVAALIGGGGYWIGSLAAADLINLAQRAPQIAHGLIAQVTESKPIALFGHSYTADQIVHKIGEALSGALGAGAVTKAAGVGAATVFGCFLIFVLMPYMMISGPRLASGAIWLIPPERRRSVTDLLPKILPVLRRYLVGVMLVVIYTATIGWIGFGLIFHLPHAVLLAIAVGVLEMIPVVGPISSAVLVAMAAFQQETLSTIIGLMGFAIALRLTIDNLVGPLVLGQAARLHPVVIMFSFVCGAMLFGVIGLLLAVPTAVCIKVALRHYYAEPIRREPPG